MGREPGEPGSSPLADAYHSKPSRLVPGPLAMFTSESWRLTSPPPSFYALSGQGLENLGVLVPRQAKLDREILRNRPELVASRRLGGLDPTLL